MKGKRRRLERERNLGRNEGGAKGGSVQSGLDRQRRCSAFLFREKTV
jgi:hypothetical protein